MMDVFVSPNDVKRAVEYFRESSFSNDDMLFFFLMSKHLGVSKTIPVTYKTGDLNQREQEERSHALWMLGGVFDSSEVCNRYAIIFPNAFGNLRKDSFYNPGTEYSRLTGRIKDTVEKKNINAPIYNNDDSALTLSYDYRNYIEEHYLRGNKISLSNLAAWLFRFTAFEFDSIPDQKAFTRVLGKAVHKYFRITKSDLSWLFEDDLMLRPIRPSRQPITGDELREAIGINQLPGNLQPDVAKPQNGDYQRNRIDLATVKNYLELRGDNPSDEDIFNLLKSKKQIVLMGVPGVGKSHYANLLRERDFFSTAEIIQFHANYSYEDFIGGETIKAEDGTSYVEPRMGVFLRTAVEAKENPDQNYLLIIDELNRGNIAEIFGETILTLDREYAVTLNRSYPHGPIDTINTLEIPDNLYILGTMNTSDRNIAFLDLAIRRRFGFVRLSPNYDFLSEEVSLDDTGIDLGVALRIINQRILEALRDPELLLGHSYFIPNMDNEGRYVWDIDAFKNQFNYVLLPTLEEYSFNDPSIVGFVVGEFLADRIDDRDDFIQAFTNEFRL